MLTSNAVEAAVEETIPATPAEPPPGQLAPPPLTLEELLAAPVSMPSAPPEQPLASGPARPEVTDSDLPMIEARCRMKAEGARWAARRQRRVAGGAGFRTEIEPLDRETVEKARELPDCFLWMNHPYGPSPSDLSRLDDMAGCFETTADAIKLVRLLLGESERKEAEFEQALDLLAEAQSALRAAVGRVGYDKQDKDQLRACQWLRATCWTNVVYIQRYMRMDDVADSRKWPSLGRRIQSLDAQVQDQQQRRKRYESGLKRAGYHQRLLISGGRGDQAVPRQAFGTRRAS